MIQNIEPYKFHVEFQNYSPEPGDYVLAFLQGEILINEREEIAFLQVSDCPEEGKAHLVYLFAVDEMKFFYWQMQNEQAEEFLRNGFRLAKRQEFRRLAPKHLAFAAVTACMLDGWYRANVYCGRCGKKTVHDTKERMLRCPECGNLIYPRINPAVIVAVTDGDRLLLTTYKGRDYKNYALVAGFVEIGEAFEDTVRREVMEEAGLKVKNIRYYGSQPWGFADNILAGYFCEVDGDADIFMDEEELSSAAFFERDKIDVEYTDSSLTNEMICAFKNRKV